MLVFASVVRAESLTQAAKDLELAKSTVSHRLAALEQKLDVVLLNRTTRRLSLTKAGQLLYGHCRTMIDEAVRAEIALETYNQQPLGRLKITCPEI